LNQKKLISIIKKSGILPVAYSPLAKGELLQEKLIIDISKKYSKTPAQIILRWLNQQNWVAIPKSSNKKRLIENINIFDFTIDENDMNSLHKLDKNYRVVPSALGTFHQIDLPSKHTNKGLVLI
jgi:diketogulonate reductase-like aldo/keto reductase